MHFWQLCRRKTESQSSLTGDQYGGLRFVYFVQQKILNFLFLSMTDQHSCVWCIISKPAVHCCMQCAFVHYVAVHCNLTMHQRSNILRIVNDVH